jgi:hypothetical protein
MNPTDLDLAFQKTFILKGDTLEGLIYVVNNYEHKGYKKSGSIFKDNDKYVQVMKNNNSSIPY